MFQLEEEGAKLTEEEKKKILKKEKYSVIKTPFKDEGWDDLDKRLLKIQTELYNSGETVKKSYSELIREIKSRVLI